MTFYDISMWVGLERWVIYGKGALPKKLRVVAMLLHGGDIKMIRSGVCPFCGRKFASRSALHLHLTKSKGFRRFDRNPSRNYRCVEAFTYMLNEIIEYTRKVRDIIRSGNGKYIVVTDVSPYPRVKTIEEAVRIALEVIRE